MTSFNDAVRALARRNGHDISDTELVVVEMTGEWSGYSEFTITNCWEAFKIKCGDFEREYENEDEERWKRYDRDHDRWYYQSGDAPGPQAALAKLWADLIEVTA